MAQWICNQCTTPFPVGLAACPHPGCRAMDAHEDGGDPSVNVFDVEPPAEDPTPDTDSATLDPVAEPTSGKTRKTRSES